MSRLLIFLCLLAAGDETPQVRHARLMREAAQGFAPLLSRDPAREADLTERVQHELAATSPWQRYYEEVSPHAVAAVAVAGVGIFALAALSCLVARPVGGSKRA